MVKLELNLPWKPVLAWPWGVTYFVDPESFLVTKHIESWDIEPWKVSSFFSIILTHAQSTLTSMRTNKILPGCCTNIPSPYCQGEH